MKPQTIPTPICRDPADGKILGLAKSAAPDFIITEDTDLLVLKEVESIPIIRPRQFWEFIKQKPLRAGERTEILSSPPAADSVIDARFYF